MSIFSLPTSSMYDIASTTSAVISSLGNPFVLSVSIFVAFLVIQFLVEILSERLWGKVPDVADHN